MRRPHSAVRDSQTSATELFPRTESVPTEPRPPGNQCNEANAQPSLDSSGPVSYGRRLGDGGYVMEPPREPPSQHQKQRQPGISSSALQRANSRLAAAKGATDRPPVSTTATASSVEFSALAKDIRLAQAAFTTPGHTLGHRATEDESNQNEHQDLSSTDCGSATDHADPSVSACAVSTCPMCLAELALGNRELHLLRCAKNPAYHKASQPCLPSAVLFGSLGSPFVVRMRYLPCGAAQIHGAGASPLRPMLIHRLWCSTATRSHAGRTHGGCLR